jgi:hypothetical protein
VQLNMSKLRRMRAWTKTEISQMSQETTAHSTVAHTSPQDLGFVRILQWLEWRKSALITMLVKTAHSLTQHLHTHPYSHRPPGHAFTTSITDTYSAYLA